MTFKNYYKSLPAKDRERYAKACGTTTKYIETHLIPARKEPRRKLRIALADNSRGALTVSNISEHFLTAVQPAA